MSSPALNPGRENGRKLMPDSPSTNELLAGILNVLQRLDSRMDEQSRSIQALTERLSSGARNDVHITPIDRGGSESTGSEDQAEFLRPGTPPHASQHPLPDKPESSSKQKSSILMPPSIVADNRHQRDQFKEAFQSSPFGQDFAKTEKFAAAAKMMRSIITKTPSPIQIFVEDAEGHVDQVDYTNDKDESYLRSKTITESTSSSTDDTLVGGSAPEPNLTTTQVPKVFYSNFPAPSAWLPGTRARTQNHALVDPLSRVDLERTGSTHLGTLWATPPDGRVDFTFQSHHLHWLGHAKGIEQIAQTGNLLQQLDDMEKNIRWDPCILIEDYGLSTISAPIQYLQTVHKVPKIRAEVSLARHPGTSSRSKEYMAPWRRIV
jgi:hypothetical protein